MPRDDCDTALLPGPLGDLARAYQKARRSIDDPPSNGVPTSNAAAASVKPITGRQRRMMLGYFQRHGVDYTDEELMIYLHDVISPNAIRPRRGELVEAGMIRDSGVRRKTQSGRQAIVWIITEKGMQS